jgi:hypothetical protein
MSVEEFKKPNLVENLEQFLSDEDTGNNNIENDIDPDYEEYLQDSFQDDIVENIFQNIVSYIDSQAIPICEFLTRDDIEDMIDDLQT